MKTLNEQELKGKELNEQELGEINGGDLDFPSNLGCGGGDGVIFNPANHKIAGVEVF